MNLLWFKSIETIDLLCGSMDNNSTTEMLSININTNQITPTKTFKLNEKMNFLAIEDLKILFDDNRHGSWEILLERFLTFLIGSKNRSQKIER